MSVDFYASGGLSSRDTTSRLVVRRQKRNNAVAKANELNLGVLRKNNKFTLLKYGNIYIIGYSC